MTTVAWDPAKHPRHPAGSERGGEFAERQFLREVREAQQAPIRGFPPGDFTPEDSVKFWPRQIGAYSGFRQDMPYGPFWKALIDQDTGEEQAFWFVNSSGFPHHMHMLDALELPKEGRYAMPAGFGTVVTHNMTGDPYGIIPRHRRDIRDANAMLEERQQDRALAASALNFEGEALTDAVARLQRQYEKVYRRAAKRAVTDYRAATTVLRAAGQPQPEEVVKAAALLESFQRLTGLARRELLKELLQALSVVYADEEDAESVALATYLDLLEAQVGVQAARLVNGAQDAAADVMLDAMAEGWSVPQTAKALQEKLESIAPWQATMLARTDLISLGNAASMRRAVLLNDPSVAYKTWLATPDERTRIDHRHAHGQTVPIQQPFTVGGEQLMYPGDPSASDAQTINCRCTLIYGAKPVPDELQQIRMLPDLAVSAAAWDESKHPRHPKGTPEGGQFRSYHVSPSRNRESIAREGLRPRSVFTDSEREAEAFAEFYRSVEPEPYDVWELDREGVEVVPDPDYTEGGIPGTWVAPGGVGPERMRLIRQDVQPDWLPAPVIPEAPGSTLDEVLQNMGAKRNYYEEGRIVLQDEQGIAHFAKKPYVFGPEEGTREPVEFGFRAISEEDWQNILKRGYMKSDGRMNLVATEGTVASLDDPTFYLPGKLASDQPGTYEGRIVKLRINDKWRMDSDGYLKTNDEIPLSDIAQVSPLLRGVRERKKRPSGVEIDLMPAYRPVTAGAWLEEEHPRWPGGTKEGGQFRSKWYNQAAVDRLANATGRDAEHRELWRKEGVQIYHVGPWAARESVAEHGLLPGGGGIGEPNPGQDWTPDPIAVYGWAEKPGTTIAEETAMDNVTQLNEYAEGDLEGSFTAYRFRVPSEAFSHLGLSDELDPVYMGRVPPEAIEIYDLEEKKWRALLGGDADGFRAAAWDPAEHPRHPAGSPQGGEFAPNENAAGAVADWSEAEQEFRKWAEGLRPYYEDEAAWEAGMSEAWGLFQDGVNTQLPALQARLNAAQVPGLRISPQLNPGMGGDMDVVLDPERRADYGPDFLVTLPAVNPGELDPSFTVWTYPEGANERHVNDPDWYEQPEGIAVEDVLDITDTDFFPDGPDSELAGAYARAVDVARGVPDEPGYVTIYRGMSDSEFDAWEAGEEIPLGKFFAGIPTAQYAQDISAQPPNLYTFRVPRHMLMQVGEHEYQLKKKGRFQNGRIEPSQPLQAAGVKYEGTGGMICLYPKPEEAEKIARRKGQAPEELHVTLLFFEDGVPGDAAEALADLAFTGLEGTISGVGQFAEGEDGVPIIGLVSVVGLNELRAKLAERLSGYSERYGFVPHMTLGYGDVADPEGAIGLPVTFSTVSVKNGDAEREDVLTAAGWDESEHPRYPKGHPLGGQFKPKEGSEEEAQPNTSDIHTVGSARDPGWTGPPLKPGSFVAQVWGGRQYLNAMERSDQAWDTTFGSELGDGGSNIDRHAQEEALRLNDMDLPGYKRAVGQNAAHELHEAELVTRTALEGLVGVAEDGVFRTQFETGHSGGAYAPEIRAAHERMFFGYPEDWTLRPRPVYGYAVTPGWDHFDEHRVGNQYGPVRWQLKQHLRSRTTVTGVDSLGRRVVPGPINNPGWRSTLPAGYNDPAMMSQRRDELTWGYADRDVAETQYHGGLTLDDVASVRLELPEDFLVTHPELDGAVKRLRARGIPVEVVGWR